MGYFWHQKIIDSEYWIFVNIWPPKFQISAGAKTWGWKPKCENTPKTWFFRILKENPWGLAPKSRKNPSNKPENPKKSIKTYSLITLQPHKRPKNENEANIFNVPPRYTPNDNRKSCRISTITLGNHTDCPENSKKWANLGF